MILSDVEIKAALKGRKIIIDPPPTEEQYTTSALDLILGNELFELKTPEELAKEEPAGVERPLIVNLAEVHDIRILLQKYAKPLIPGADGSFITSLSTICSRDYQRAGRTPKAVKDRSAG